MSTADLVFLADPGPPPANYTAGLTDVQHNNLWREWDVYLRRVALRNDYLFRNASITASTAHATAQANTAAAINANVNSQQAMIAAMNQPVPQAQPSDTDLLLTFTKILVGNGAGSAAATLAKEYVKAYRAASVARPSAPAPT